MIGSRKFDKKACAVTLNGLPVDEQNDGLPFILGGKCAFRGPTAQFFSTP